MIRQLTADDFTEFKKLCVAQHEEAKLPQNSMPS